MSLQTTLQALLSPLAAGGAANLRARQNSTVPYLVWQRVIQPTNTSAGGPSDVQNTRIQVDAYAKDYPTAESIAAAASAAILGAALQATRIGVQDFFEDDTQLYRVSQDFSVWSA